MMNTLPVKKAKHSSTDWFISQSSSSSKLLESLPSTWYLLRVLVESKADKFLVLLSIPQSLCDVTSVRKLQTDVSVLCSTVVFGLRTKTKINVNIFGPFAKTTLCIPLIFLSRDTVQ